jgi:hypothetical protein
LVLLIDFALLWTLKSKKSKAYLYLPTGEKVELSLILKIDSQIDVHG